MHSPRTNWGRLLFGILWVAGLGTLAAMAARMLPAPPLVVGAIILGLCVTIAIGCISQSCGFFAQPLRRVAGTPGRLAITFDDGPDAEFTPRVLDLLAQNGQRATFFVVADKVRAHPELARRIVEDGHELGNHTASHPWHFALWSPRRVAAELSQANEMIVESTGVAPTLFRSPAAVLSPRVERGARQAGLELVGYTIRSGDGSPVIPPGAALMVLRWGLRDGAILMLHDAAVGNRPPISLTILPQLFDEMRRRKLNSVTVSELLRLGGAGASSRH